MPRGTPRLRMADRMNVIGRRARSRRRELTLKQDQVCGRIAAATSGRWSPGWQDLSRIENGGRIVSDVEVLAIAQALDCDPCWLLVGT